MEDYEDVINWCRDNKCDFIKPIRPTPEGWTWCKSRGTKQLTLQTTEDGDGLVISLEHTLWLNASRLEGEDYDVVYNLNWQKGCHKGYATDAEAYRKVTSKKALLKKYVKEYNDLLSQKEYIESRLLSLSDKIDELEGEE